MLKYVFDRLQIFLSIIFTGKVKYFASNDHANAGDAVVKEDGDADFKDNGGDDDAGAKVAHMN